MKTTTKKRIVCVIGSMSIVIACAADRTWDGGGSDVNWSTVANWDGDAAAPVAGDALFFGGSARLINTNDLTAGMSIAGLAFNSGAGAFTLRGNAVTLEGDITNGSSNAQTVSLPLTLNDARTVYAVGGAVTLGGALDGTGGLVKEGAQYLYLTASNSYDGVTWVNTGVVRVAHANALGSTVGGTTVNTLRNARLELAGLMLAEPITLINGKTSSSCFQTVSGSNVLSSVLTSSGSRIYVNGGTSLTLEGGITGNPFFVVNGSGTLYVRKTPCAMGTGNFYADDSSLTIIDVASNAWSELTIAKGVVCMNAKDALPESGTVRIGLSYGLRGTLDLNGFDQTTAKLYNGAVGGGASNRVTSATPATLTINQNTSSVSLECCFSNAVGVLKGGTGTLILTNAISSTTGGFTVTNGTLVVATTARLGGTTNVVISGSGTMELRETDAICDAAAVSIADGGAKLKINAGLSESVGRLYLGATPATKGTYGATGSGAAVIDDTHFGGTGLLNVLQDPPLIPTNYVWDATGADTLLDTAANWEGDATPEMGGTSILTFGSGGSTATVDTDANLYGLVFNRDANFTLAAGDGALTLGPGGLTAAAPSSTSRAYAIAEDMTLAADQVWSVTNASGSTSLTVSGVIADGEGALGITKTGNGGITLSGDNTFDGVFSNLVGVLYIGHSNALGSTVGGTVINTASKARLELSGGLSLSEPLTFIGGSVDGNCIYNSGGSNTILGPVVTSGGRYAAGSGTLLFKGGVTGTSPFFVVNAGSTIAFTTTPLDLGTGTFHTDSGGLTILGVASNKWATTVFTGGTLRMDVADAFPTNSLLKVGGVWYGPSCTLNLNGFDQTAGSLSRAEPTPGTIVITSPTPATLTLNQSGSYGFDGAFAGQVSLVKDGVGTLTITNASTSTAGSFVVSNGTLSVASDGTLGPNSTNIVVGGTGTLAISNSAVISDHATVRIADDGAKINLGTGVNESVGYLVLGEKMRRVGTYGSTSSSAANKDDTYFAGTGVLTVLHDKSGTLLRVM